MKTKSNLEWAKMLGELGAFREAYGHLRVEEQRKRFPALASWFSRVRTRLATLTYPQIRDLDQLGFFVKGAQRWLNRYAWLRDFETSNGHYDVPVRWPENQQLACWVQTQRRDAAKMVSWRRKLLTDLGFRFRIRGRGLGSSTDWDEVITRLAAFKRRFGHCNVPARWKEDKTLAAWVYRLRSIKKSLAPGIIKHLDALRFDWDPYHSAWEKRYRELKSFKTRFGHCDVPVQWRGNRTLGVWVQTQRRDVAEMAPWKRKLLTDLGFRFRIRGRGLGSSIDWDEAVKRLNAYKQRFGDFNVPPKWPEDKRLAHWVSQLRFHKWSFDPKIIARLDTLGFEWDPLQAAFEKRFRELVTFKLRHGHFRVSNRSRPLGIWVAQIQKDKRKLSQGQIRRLKQIGFD